MTEKTAIAKPKSIKKIPLPGIEGAWLVISTRQVKYEGIEYTHPEMVMTFVFDAGDIAAEWEPEHGPLQTWYRCGEGDSGAQPHHFYEWHNTPPASWSQIAVDNYGLHHALYEGDYKYIFAVLADWARNR